MTTDGNACIRVRRVRGKDRSDLNVTRQVLREEQQGPREGYVFSTSKVKRDEALHSSVVPVRED